MKMVLSRERLAPPKCWGVAGLHSNRNISPSKLIREWQWIGHIPGLPGVCAFTAWQEPPAAAIPGIHVALLADCGLSCNPAEHSSQLDLPEDSPWIPRADQPAHALRSYFSPLPHQHAGGSHNGCLAGAHLFSLQHCSPRPDGPQPAAAEGSLPGSRLPHIPKLPED